MFQKIAVIGAGQMGSGIAHVSALVAREVVLVDVSQEALDAASRSIAHNLDRQVRKGVLTADNRDQALERLVLECDYAKVEGCDALIEAATENEEIKRTIFQTVTPYLSPKTLLATNTSSLSITRLATATDRPDRFCGVHFMNPVPIMKLVELIPGMKTSDETFSAFKSFVETSLQKETAVSADYPGFIMNRILMPMINEAIYVLHEGVAETLSIDRGMTLGTHHPMGPLRLADFIGLDTCRSILSVLHREFGDQKYRPCPLLTKYVEAGWLGVKTGKGFYDYTGEAPVPTR